MKKTAIILAGGEGRRMKSDIPKQFILLKKKPILIHTLEKFSEFDQIIIVLPKDQIKYWQNLCLKYKCSINHSIVKGGKTRFEFGLNDDDEESYNNIPYLIFYF